MRVVIAICSFLILCAILTLQKATGADAYFPPETNKQPAGIPESKAKRFSKHLAAMDEPSLYSRQIAGQHQYRFLWLRTFHKPVAVRVYQTDKGFQLRAIRLSGKGGYEPGKVEWEKNIAINDAQWKRIQTHFATDAVLKPLTEEQGAMLGMDDGAEWILEERDGAAYNIAHVQSPQSLEDSRFRLEPQLSFKIPDLKPFIRCCLYFLELAEIREEDMY